MASERDKAKSAITRTDSTDPELAAALAEGKQEQYRITVENNRHKEAIQAGELGRMGQWLGGEKMAPIVIAAIVVVAGLLGAFLSGYMASTSQRPDAADYWYRMVQTSLALSASALSFIFGRTGRR
ncbi:MAG: hypothetical protein ABSE46_17690 [Terracidiphilus sp.]|jgi:hypothetical protein